MGDNVNDGWWAKGLLFENCNCQVVCPAHVSFKQLCTHERCVGHWSMHFDEGRSGPVVLDDLNVIILYDSPQQMFAGDWVEAMYIDERATEAQRRALERILMGQAGGPWAVLGRFVSKRLETRFVPIVFEDHGRQKRMSIESWFDTSVEAVRGKDPEREVLLENMFNQIHAPTQVIARGTSRLDREDFALSNAGTHALYSRFSWSGP